MVGDLRDFTALVERATGRRGQAPYPWQARVAEEGLPELISIETGAGKTEGVVLPWLWRRRFHPDPAVRAGTPHWLVLCLPLRTLTEQTERAVDGWLRNLGLATEDDRPGVRLHVAMGGRQDGKGDRWRRHLEDDAVVVGTVDTLLSRALNRGYALSRFAWPIDFALLNNGCHWVFDEIQLLGPALATGRQLEALRRRWGTALPSRSTWMSATVDLDAVRTVDFPHVSRVVTLRPEDRVGALVARLDGTRRVERLAVNQKRYAPELAEVILGAHRPGSLTVAMVNTVATARSLFQEVAKRAHKVPVVLLHSRFRPPDRAAAVRRALGELPAEGRIVVSTQVLEAGVDLSATTLVTEAAPWPSIVQRAGRCNRDGLVEDAQLLWVEPTRFAPYEEGDVRAAMEALAGLEGETMTATALREVAVATSRPVTAVLRSSDLLGLFDTAPDLSGNDVDVARFIRLTDDLDLYLAWRDLGAQAPSPEDPRPSSDELCPLPAGRDAKELAGRTALWRFDHLSGGWERVRSADIRPGLVLVTDVAAGGYDPDTGWDPSSRARVPLLAEAPRELGLVDPEEPLGSDAATFVEPGVWVALTRHLGDVEEETASLLERLAPVGLTDADQLAAVAAARLHDIGKAHTVFQDTMLRSAGDEERERVEAGRPWAKSGGASRTRHRRRYFRHELASALALLDAGSAALGEVKDPDLVVYLVAAHHGRVRMRIRSVPEEERDGTTLGIGEGDPLAPVELPDGMVPSSRLSLKVMGLGRSADGQRSWSERALELRDREDLGPFRLAFLEAVVRLADWRASAAEAEGDSDL